MTDTPPTPPNDSDPFYVGYLDTPPQHRNATRLAIIFIIIWLGMCSLLLVLAQRSPGEAVWDISNEKTWTGTLIEHPYPMLITPDETLLVVSMGKISAHEQLGDAFGSNVTLRGFELHREGRKMIELNIDDQAVAVQAPSTSQTPTIEIIDEQPREFTGEIIDGKCYLGAMKPGDGFGHRACAVLCIRGGLPPMFAIETENANTPFPLILVDGQAVLPEELYKWVAQRVTLNARQGTFGTLPVLLIEPDSLALVNEMLPPESTTIGVVPTASD